MKAAIYIVFLFSALLTACNRSSNVSNVDDIGELTEFFYQNQEDFNNLADAACAYFSKLPIGFERFKVDEPVVYPEHSAEYARKMNIILKKIKKREIILHQTDKVECSLFIKQWVHWQSDGGSHIGYSYQPPNLNPYSPAIHKISEKHALERVHFTQSLENGWYIEYVNIP